MVMVVLLLFAVAVAGLTGYQLVQVEAEALFLDALTGTSDPEAKRKAIGRLFIDVFEAEAKKLGGAEFLAGRHIAIRPSLELIVVTRRPKVQTVPSATVQLAYRFDGDTNRPARR